MSAEEKIPATPGADVLTMDKVTLNFGGLAAVSNVELRLGEGELVGLIGPNGAGKTSIFNLLTGVYPPSKGQITFYRDGKPFTVGRKRPYQICRAGIGRTFQNIRLFKDLTALENVQIALQQNVRYGLFSAFTHLPPFGRKEREIRAESERLLDVVGLAHHAGTLARNLPYGDQRHLEIARALATQPTLLLLDEPAAGMNPNETTALTELIRWLRDEFKLTILLIEHDMSLVMNLCERLYVLDHGIIISEGDPEHVQNDPRVIEAYLGEDANV